MIASTIPSKFTDRDKSYLLTFEASQLDSLLKEKRDEAYLMQDYSRATKLERYSSHAQARVNRRFENLIIN